MGHVVHMLVLYVHAGILGRRKSDALIAQDVVLAGDNERRRQALMVGERGLH